MHLNMNEALFGQLDKKFCLVLLCVVDRYLHDGVRFLNCFALFFSVLKCSEARFCLPVHLQSKSLKGRTALIYFQRLLTLSLIGLLNSDSGHEAPQARARIRMLNLTDSLASPLHHRFINIIRTSFAHRTPLCGLPDDSDPDND
jgi:hypothetical protein